MKFITTLTAAAVLSACALTVDQKAVLADATIAQIQALNAAGIDPVTLDEQKLAVLSTGCVMIAVVYPDRADDVALACLAIGEAAK